MDVDEPSFTFVSCAYIEEDKARYRKEGQCFCCNKQGHMARECPSHKQQLGKPQKPMFRKKPYPTSYKKPTQQRFIKRAPRGYIPQAHAASIEEMNEDANDKEMEENNNQGSYSEGYQDNYDQESYCYAYFYFPPRYMYYRTALPLLPDSTRHMPISRCLADTA